MRLLFLAVIVLLLQLFSYGVGSALQWFLRPWVSRGILQAAMWFVFLMSNGLLLLTIMQVYQDIYRWVSGWLVLMWFILLVSILVGLVHLIAKQILSTEMMSLLGFVLGIRLLAVSSVVGLFAVALFNAYVPVVRHLSIQIDKPLSQPIRVAVASDLHLGTLFGAKQLDDLSKILKDEKADMLLMPGDIMDDDTLVFDAQGMSKNMQQLTNAVPFGVYATLGNHDVYGHQAEISQAIIDSGVYLLNDTAYPVTLGQDRLWIVGRLDDHIQHRLETEQILVNTNVNEPIFLLDHRPSQIEHHSHLPIDLQVSGHTHNGQIFPANFIVKAINRLAYGYEKIGKGHYVVTSGYGFWGIPFRLGSRSEVWIIEVSGKN